MEGFWGFGVDASACQRNVSGHDDIAGLDMIHYPVVRSIKTVTYNLKRDARIIRNAHPGVGD